LPQPNTSPSSEIVITFSDHMIISNSTDFNKLC
jgi:hypothetical protein